MIDQQIENWKMKKLIKKLSEARGNGTSIISLVIPPGSQISQTNKLLTEEYGTATNIKSRVNRLSVLEAITSAQQRLKLYTKVPTNGLILYCGTVLNDEGKERKVTVDFEPIKPINTSLYMCDNKFHTEVLQSLIQEDEVYGFIIMNGEGTLFGTLVGNTRNILYQVSVNLPKKHNKGGQSSVRFARLRIEARHNYVSKISELATQYFITNDIPNVKGLILGGSADFKTELQKANSFDPRLLKVVLQVVDVAYGGNKGFLEAIELASETLGNTRFIQEKKLLQQFYEEINKDTGKYCFTIDDTMKALEMGAVETLVIWTDLPTERFVVQSNKVQSIIYDVKVPENVEIIESISFVEWLANNYNNYGAKLEFISDSSEEGTQYIKGFGGVGGLLRWKVDFDVFEEEEQS